MLQQTTVATVTPRFAHWMKLFPSLHDLALATEEEVLSAWQGLGYYSRALRLHATAKTIMDRHGGVIPDQQNILLSLPGIGTYTAAAITAFAYDQHALVLDTNIIRVLARWANLELPINTAEGKKALEKIAQAFYPRDECRIVASALMDLGATLCITGIPKCADCPLKKTCQAKRPEQLPQKAPRTVILKLNENRAWFYQNSRLYLEQSHGPRWRGLWILPELGSCKAKGRALAEITYPITRYRIAMKVYRTKDNPPSNLRGFTAKELKSVPLPSPHRRAIEKVLSSC
jgi:A/G-specific adenine glycosylase